jgi:hypothetical protein
MTPSERTILEQRLARLQNAPQSLAAMTEISAISDQIRRSDLATRLNQPSATSLPTNAATASNQDTEIESLSNIEATDFATEAKQDTGNTSLASILSKIIDSPSTEAKQDSTITALANLLTELQLKADLTETQPVIANAPIQSRAMSRFYNIRGQRYIATTGYIQQTLNTVGEPIALLKNPSGSGQVFLFDKAEFGTTASCRFSRYGGGTTPLIGTPTPRVIGRTDGGTSTSTMELYIGGNSSPQFAVSGGGFVAGTLRKVAAMLSYDTYQLLDMDATAVLQPGQQAYWIVDEIPGGGAGNFHTFIDFEWVEMPTATWSAMVTALQAKPEY